jgi:hypothetical protein
MSSREAANADFITHGLTQPGIEPTIYLTRDNHINYNTITLQSLLYIICVSDNKQNMIIHSQYFFCFRSENVTLMNVVCQIQYKCCLFAIYQSLSRAFNIFQVYQYFTIYRRYFVSVVCVKQSAPQNVVRFSRCSIFHVLIFFLIVTFTISL